MKSPRSTAILPGVTLRIDSTLPLNTGSHIPRFGLGVFRAGESTQSAVEAALECGYRHIDTASAYQNEEGVGQAIRASGIPREQLFVTTKLFREAAGYDEAKAAMGASLERLGLDYVDLYLMHWPVAEHRNESWRGMESAVDDGRARAIGVSNFEPKHIESLLADAKIVPAVNQVELHPFWQRANVVEYCRAKGIAVEAWGPLTKGQRLDDPTLTEVAAACGKTSAQVLIRWSLQHDFIVIPKSTNPTRIAENAAVFDFELDPAQMAKLDALEEGYRTAPGWDPTTAD